jgi:hypothetical protein
MEFTSNGKRKAKKKKQKLQSLKPEIVFLDLRGTIISYI